MKRLPIKVLLVEDNPAHARLVQELLSESSRVSSKITRESTLQKGRELLSSGEFDVMLLDLGLPDSQGLDTVVRIMREAPRTPIIVLTGLEDETVAMEAMAIGAQDFLSKGRMDPDGLSRAMLYAMERARSKLELQHALEISEKRQNEIQALYEGAHEVLNRFSFEQAAKGIFDICKKLIGCSGGYVAVLSSDGLLNELLFLDSGQAACTVGPNLPMPVRGLREKAYKTASVAYENSFPQSPWAQYLPMGHMTLENVLFAPMVIAGKSTGIIGLANKPGGFSEEDARMAMGFAELLALAFKNSRNREALGSSLLFLETLLDTIPNPVFYKDAKCRFLGCNTAFAEKIVGLPKGQILGKTVFDLPEPIPADLAESYAQQDMDLLREPGCRFYESQAQCADGIRRDYFFSKATFRDSSGHVAGIVGVMADLSEMKKLEEKLRQAQKMESIGTLAGGIAHDFNNILTPIIGFTELVLGETSEGSLTHSNLMEVRRSAERARELVRQILTFSRRTETAFMPVQLHLIVREVVKLLKSTLPSFIHIEQRINPSGYTVADPTQIHQVVMNLCTNAYHAMRDEGGTLTVELGPFMVDEETASRHLDMEPGPYIRLAVRDTGCGMGQDVLCRIFDPYFTTKKMGEGTGLGLAMVHGIIKAHGGAVVVESSPGMGSVFFVYFKKAANEENLDNTPEQASFPKGQGQVLLVDDEETIVRLCGQMLSSLGYNVQPFTDPTLALSMFLSAPKDFDLVITDMAMPQMRGDKLALEILAARPDIPIILCTGFSDQISEQQAREMGIRNFILKPLHMAEFAQVVREAMSASASSSHTG